MTPATLRTILITLALAALYLCGMWLFPTLTYRLIAFGFVLLACAFGAFYLANLLRARREGRQLRYSLHLLALFVAALLLKVAFGSAIPRSFSLPIFFLTVLTGVWCYLVYWFEARTTYGE